MRILKNKNLLIIVIIYLCVMINLLLKNDVFFSHIVNPLFWLCISLYVIWDIKNSYLRLCIARKYTINMIIISSLHICFYFYIGYIFGFSKSPYNHEILTMFKNIIIKLIPIVGIEMTRNIIITRNKSNKILLAFVAIIGVLLEINYNTLINIFPNKEAFFKYVCSTILPTFACSILYTYLDFNNSFLLVLIYRFFKDLIVFLIPILPDLDWFVTASINILSPTLVYILFKYKFAKQRKNHIKKSQNIFEKISYSITLIFLVGLICFMLGAFKYEPITILSNSMSPLFNRGDVVIFRKINDSNLNEISKNSIIIYSIENQNIAHRVVDKIEKNNTISYQTKGDSNNVADTNLVQINQIKGVYLFHIKYIGFPSVWLYDYFNK